MQNLMEQAQLLGTKLNHLGLLLCCAESCTGGMLSQYLTSIPGSSMWFDRSFITYSNRAKSELLGVDEKSLEIHGAVSEEVAKQMAEGAIKQSRVDVSISITGIAGPKGGTADKPVGTVCFAWVLPAHETFTRCLHFEGSREQIRQQACNEAMHFLSAQL